MIIASPVKEELVIQLPVLQQQQQQQQHPPPPPPQQQQQQQQQQPAFSQPPMADQQAQSSPTSAAMVWSTLRIAHMCCSEEDDHEDVIQFIRRDHRDQDFVSIVFHRLSGSVDRLMRISMYHGFCKPVQYDAFIHENTVFATFPSNERWEDDAFRSCITRTIELAEERTGCENLVITIDRRSGATADLKLLGGFMHLGFQMIDPSVYGQEAGFVLLGYEL
ncbi:hypothetical protein BX666DRAFT_8977 [Dichotomocladium elegans]|nr:hypothetical protein BX666DRAFT_8977 [Dichotomocladium elegans]